jgi:nucleotide-binding universal stress UspA family protein
MSTAIRPGWSKPSQILFACEFPADEKAFAVALKQAAEFDSHLILFHVYEPSDSASPNGAGAQYSTARDEKHRFASLAQRAENLGIPCQVVVRSGSASDEILAFLQEQKIDRVIMGAHSPGPIGKLLVGSVAEAVLRRSTVPVCIVGPNVVECTYRNYSSRKVLCDVSAQAGRHTVASFGAEVAAKHKASFILQQVIPPQEHADLLAGRTLGQVESELLSLVPAELHNGIHTRTKAVLGDPTEELLIAGRAQGADLIVLGTQGASHFAAITHSAIFYKVLAYAHCPVLTLSPVVLAEYRVKEDEPRMDEVNYMAGVI